MNHPGASGGTLGVKDLCQKRPMLPSFYSRSMRVPTGPDRQDAWPDSTGQYAESQLHRYPLADTVARHRMSKMTNETRAPQLPDIRNSADLSPRVISPTNELCPSSVFGDPILRARAGVIEVKISPDWKTLSG